jgi:hypothetical protein
MSRPLPIFLSSLVILGMVQLDRQVLAQSSKEITNSIGMKLVLIPKGTFTMGSPESEERRRPQESQHDVTLSKDYFIGAYEVTQSEYQQVMNKNPSFVQGAKIRDSSRHPVEQVSWNDAVEFVSDCQNCRRRRGPVACIVYRQKQNGNTLAALAVRLPIALERVQKLWMITHGMMREAIDRLIQSAKRSRTLGDYSTCTVMSGNGVATGTGSPLDPVSHQAD